MNQYAILVADTLGAEGLEILEGAGAVTVRTGMDEATNAAAITSGSASARSSRPPATISTSTTRWCVR